MVNIIFGILLFGGLVFGAGVIGGNPLALIDLTSLAVVLGIAAIGTISSSLGAKTKKIFSNFGNFSIIAGWIGFLIGLVLILKAMDISDLSKLSPALSVAILPPLYGYFFKFCSMIGEYYYAKGLTITLDPDDQNSPQGVEVDKVGLIFPSPDGARYSISVDSLGNIRSKRL